MKIRFNEALDELDDLDSLEDVDEGAREAQNTIIDDVKVGDTFEFEAGGHWFNVSVTQGDGLTIYADDEEYYIYVMGTKTIGVNLNPDIVFFIIYPDDNPESDPIADWWTYGLTCNSIYDLCNDIAYVLNHR